MSIKDKFTDDEWKLVLQSPMLTGIAITAADPSGLWGMLKEGFGVASSLQQAKASPGDSLPGMISSAFDHAEGRKLAQENLKEQFKGKKPAQAADIAVTRLGDVCAIVAAKAPEQVEAYKTFIRAIAQKVAESATEGGFLGFGGEKVSAAEQKTLDDIDRVLG
ncbi:hypothetical protein G8770_02115 [Aestuariicella hydrocarbonica]|uniref:Uncharacterized protein n=1 Tax=Pseudomaricurvus hydrocarbonicus TaxID=1470433 RepID=A0A9E5MJQ6_9GAMM|nr:hypothetical protein [Aestuariicella hydrocarbonica]NHO64342.1 hypothetical protein [Aestuariicella hydrocarbonica]